MRKVVAISLSFAPFLVAGCMAFGGDTKQQTGTIQVSWETLLTIYGPMAAWLGWFIRRDYQRDLHQEEQRKEMVELIKSATEVMTEVRATLTLTRVDDDKHRTAIYRLVEEVRDMAVQVKGFGDDVVRGNTRVMFKE